LKPWRPVQATAQQQRTKRLGLPQWSGVPDVATWPRSPAGKCSKPADTPPPRSRRRLRPCEVTRHRTSAASWGVAGRAGRRANPGNHQRADRPALV